VKYSRFIRYVIGTTVSMILFLSMNAYAFADVNVGALEGILNNLIGQQRINQSNNPALAERNNSTEYIDPMTGSLMLKETDLVLPGRDGLDLALTRVYNSSMAEDGTKKVSVTSSSSSSSSTETCYVALAQRYDTETGDFTPIEESYSTSSKAWIAYYKYYFMEPEPGDRYVYYAVGVYKRSVKTTYRSYTVRTKNYTEKDNYYRDRYDLGTGWSLGFPSVQVLNDKGMEYIYFHDGTGSSSRVVITPELGDSNLENHNNRDVVFDYATNAEFSYGGKSAKYKFISSNKQTTYFSADGVIIGIVDRFGNKISFDYINRTINGVSHPYISRIVDSVGRNVAFTYENKIDSANFTSENIEVAVTSPNSNDTLSMTYCKGRGKINKYLNGVYQESYYVPYLYYVRNPEDEYTLYKYRNFNDGKFHFTKKNPGSSSATRSGTLLTEVRYPLTSSKYEYETVTRNLGEKGFSNEYRVSTRYDQEAYSLADSSLRKGNINRINYSYHKDYTGYPEYISSVTMPEQYLFSSEYSTTDGIKVKNEFNGKKKLKTQSTINSDNEKKVIEYVKYHDTFKGKSTEVKVSEYDKNGQPYKQRFVKRTYNEWGGLASETRPLPLEQINNQDLIRKHTMEYEYESAYKFLKSRRWYQNEANQLTETYEYNNGRISAHINEMGERTNFQYELNADGKVTKLITSLLLPDGRESKNEKIFSQETNFAYPSIVKGYYSDQDGKITETVNTYTYNMLLGLISTDTNSSGNFVEYEYDKLGRVLCITQPQYSDLDGNKYQFAKHFRYRVVKHDSIWDGSNDTYQLEVYSYTTRLSENSSGVISSANYLYDFKCYDGYGNLSFASVWDYNKQDGWHWRRTVENVYDDYNRAIKSLDADKNSYGYNYDSWGKHSETIDAFGNLHKTEVLLSENKVLDYFVAKDDIAKYKSESNNDVYKQNLVETVFDEWNNVSERSAFPNWPDRSNRIYESFTYDFSGNLTKYTDPNRNLNEENCTKSFVYDDLNRIVKVKDALNQVILVDYNILGNIQSIDLKENDASASSVNVFKKSFNELGDNVSKTKGEHDSNYSYNQLGLVEESVDRNNNRSTYSYDEMNRLKSMNELNYQTNASHRTDYYYSSPYGLKSVKEYKDGVSIGKTENYYTATGLTRYTGSEHFSQDRSISYRASFERDYDKLNRVIQQSVGLYAGEFYQNYDYEKTRLSGIQADGNESVDSTENSFIKYQYYPDGKIDKIVYPVLKDGSQIKVDNNYDKLNRLESVTNYKGSQVVSEYHYSYDSNGNIIKVNDGQSETDYQYDQLDRLKKIIRPTETIEYTYDLRGNRTSVKVDKAVAGANEPINTLKGNVSYEFNERNQLVSADDTEFDYLSNGLRYYKKTPEKTILYHYNQNGKVIAEADETGKISAYYVWDDDQVLAKVDPTTKERYYYLYNGHGDVIQIMDEAGTIVNSYSYDEWGNILSIEETIHNPFKYSGEIFDEETGLYYLRARYYNPQLGRFISEDTYEGRLTDIDSMNTYIYCLNNPLKYADPSGHLSIWQTGKLFKGIASGIVNGFIDDVKGIFSLIPGLYQMGKALSSGKLSVLDLAKSMGAAVVEPFAYLAENFNHVFIKGKPSNQEVEEYGRYAGTAIKTVIEMVAGGAVGGKFASMLSKSCPKMAKSLAKVSGKFKKGMKATNSGPIKKFDLQFFASKTSGNIVDVSKKAQKTIKKLSPEAKKGYKKALDGLTSGDLRGLNAHALKGNRSGQWAIDVKGMGRGRGAGRVIYEKLSDGSFEIIEVLTKHDY